VFEALLKRKTTHTTVSWHCLHCAVFILTKTTVLHYVINMLCH